MADVQVTDPVPEGTPAPARRRPRLVLWAVLAVLAVGVGAVAVAARDDDPPRLPIALGAGSAGGGAAPVAEGDAAMTMLAAFRYVAGDDLPALGGDGPAYRLPGEVDLDRLREVAAAFGVEGEPEELDRGTGTWQIEGADGATVGASAYGGGQWWYSPMVLQAGSSSGSSGCPDDLDARACEELLVREREAAVGEGSAGAVVSDVPACTPDGSAESCDTPAPPAFTTPADLPSREGAERAVRDRFQAMGVDLTDARVTVEGPGDAWYVTIEPRIDGLVVSGYSFYASVGSKGAITSAGGVLRAPTKLGDYPMLDTRAALERFDQQTAGWSAYGEGAADLDLDCAATAVAPSPSDGGPGVDLGAGEGLDAGDPLVRADEGCMPVPVEPIEVVLHDAEPILMLVPSSEDDRSSYLVPGYRMHGDDGHWVDVLAVDDDSLVPAPVEPQPVPLPEPEGGPMVPDPGGVDRVDPSGPVRDPDGPVATEPSGGGGTTPRQ